MTIFYLLHNLTRGVSTYVPLFSLIKYNTLKFNTHCGAKSSAGQSRGIRFEYNLIDFNLYRLHLVCRHIVPRTVFYDILAKEGA